MAIQMPHPCSRPGEAGRHRREHLLPSPVSVNRAPDTRATVHLQTFAKISYPKFYSFFQISRDGDCCAPPLTDAGGSRLQVKCGPVQGVRVTTTPLVCEAVTGTPLTAARYWPNGLREIIPRSQGAGSIGVPRDYTCWSLARLTHQDHVLCQHTQTPEAP